MFAYYKKAILKPAPNPAPKPTTTGTKATCTIEIVKSYELSKISREMVTLVCREIVLVTMTMGTWFC